MESRRRIAIWVGCAALLVAAAPVSRSDLVTEEIQSAMIQEAYGSFVNAWAAQQLRAEGWRDLAVLLDRTSRRNQQRFEDHSRILPADGLEDRLTQVFGAALAQEIQYSEAAVKSREEGDAGLAEHFDRLAKEAREDRETLQQELQKAFGAPQIHPYPSQ